MQNDELAIQDVPPAAELFKRLSIVEKNAMEKVQSLESQVANLQSQLAAARVLPDSPLKDLPCFAPYKKEDGRIILSSVVSDTKEWYQSGLLIPHEALRRDIIEVDYLLKNHIRGDEPWKLVNFFDWFDNRFIKIIHAHHDSEEKIFFPFIKTRCDLPDKTSADHKVLMKLLDEISHIGKKFHENGGDANNIQESAKTLPLLAAKWSEMSAAMLPHLAEEEEQMVTFIKDKFTKEDMDSITTKIVKDEGLGGARLFLPSIAESLEMWATQENLKSFVNEIPPPIRFLLRVFWSKSYAKYHRGVLNSFRAGSPKVIIKQRGWFF